QEGRFFHGYYRSYCYLPLYIFAGDFLLCAKLRTADGDGAAGAVEEVARLVGQIRERWPTVPIVVRADSGFAREELMAWCEAHGVDFVLGLARNARLEAALTAELAEAHAQLAATGVPARVYQDFIHQPRKPRSRAQRAVGKADGSPGRGQPR